MTFLAPFLALAPAPSTHIGLDELGSILALGALGSGIAFALNYANESDQRGSIPMFPYYELFQSNGDCNACNENQKNLANLNTPSVMLAYFQNFALLMQRLGPGTHDGIHGHWRTYAICTLRTCCWATRSRATCR